MKPVNFKGLNKDARIHVRRSSSVYNILFCAGTLCTHYAAKTLIF